MQKVTLYAEKDEYEFLLENKELLMTVFIVSGLEIEKNERKNEEKIGVKVEVADGKNVKDVGCIVQQ